MESPTLTGLLRQRKPYERHCRAVKDRTGLGHANRTDITRSDLGSFVSIYAHRGRSIITSAIPFVLFAWGAERAPAGIGAITNAMTVLFTALMAFVLYREPVGRQRMVGLLTGFLGVIVLAADKTGGGGVWPAALDNRLVSERRINSKSIRTIGKFCAISMVNLCCASSFRVSPSAICTNSLTSQ